MGQRCRTDFASAATAFRWRALGSGERFDDPDDSKLISMHSAGRRGATHHGVRKRGSSAGDRRETTLPCVGRSVAPPTALTKPTLVSIDMIECSLNDSVYYKGLRVTLAKL
jgi:hypothetical protein